MKNIIIQKIKNGIPVVIETDTIYGISMLRNEENKYKINALKKSDKDKDLISLFSNFSQIRKFVKLEKNIIKLIRKSKKTTFILLDKDNNKIALRYVSGFIGSIIKKTGPIFSTSANFSNNRYTENIEIFSELVGKENVYFRKKKGLKSSTIIDLINLKKVR